MIDSRCATPGQCRLKSGTKSATCAAALTLISACATTPDEATSGFAPPAVGTEIDWEFTYSNGARETLTSRLIATGKDFAIFLADTELAGDQPYHYYAEFVGGVFYTSCGEPMPSTAEREAALGLWPLSTGETAAVGEGIRIGQQDRVTVNGRPADVVWSDFTYSRDGKTYTDEFAVATEIGASVSVRYDDGSVGIARAFRPGDGNESDMIDREPERLGNCESLIPL